MSDCNCHSEITRDGSGQLQRYLKALDPSYAPVDGRSMEDLLVFAKRYAKQIRFYDVPESSMQEADPKKPAATWSEFFRNDMAVIAASLSITDLEQIKKDYDETNAKLNQHPTEDLYAALYTNILGMAARIDRWYSTSLAGYPLRNDLELGIASSLRPAMQQIMAYEKGYPLVEGRPLKLDYAAISNRDLWGLDDEVVADTGIYAGATPGEKMLHASLFTEDVFLKFYSFMTTLVRNGDDYLRFALQDYPKHQPHMALFIAFLEIFRLAQDQMNGLTGRMLDFYYRDVLHLSEHASAPDRVHLVFELAKDVAEYDLAGGTTLLAGKDASGKEQVYALETDAILNSAKVSELKTLFIQKRALTSAATGQAAQSLSAFYARPVAKSADGKGAKFTVAAPKWPTLGEGWPTIERPQNICEYLQAVDVLGNTPASAEVGFAVASPQLLLQGGKRLLKIKFEGLYQISQIYNVDGDHALSISLSAEKAWLEIPEAKLSAKYLDAIAKAADQIMIEGEFPADNGGDAGFFIANGSLYIYLPISAPPIVAFDPKLHTGRNYDTKHPVMQVSINPAAGVDEKVYQSKGIGSFSVEVRVGSVHRQQQKQNAGKVPPPALFSQGPSPEDVSNSIPAAQTIHAQDVQIDGLRKLTLQNDLGLLDPNKPFDPFTSYPTAGKSLYIGSDEIFNKNISELAIEISTTQDGSLPVKFKPRVLLDRSWLRLADVDSFGNAKERLAKDELAYNIYNRVTGEQEVPVGDAGTVTALKAVPLRTARTPLISAQAWSGAQARGFLRIDLDSADNQNGINGDNFEASAALAPLLQIKELAVSYYSMLEGLEQGIDQMFHIYPFGVAEIQIPAFVGKDASGLLVATTIPASRKTLLNARNLIFPQFTFTNPDERYTAVLTSTPGSNSGINYNQNALNNGSAGADTYSIEALREKFKNDKASLLMLEASGLAEKQGDIPNQYYAAAHYDPADPATKFVGQEEGMLFIGLEGAKPLMTVSLLFQFAEGSAKDNDSDPPKINWAYLAGNEWRPLKGEHLVADDTYGFQTTGIVKLEIPADATTSHSIITDGLHWFSASVSSKSECIPQAVDVVAQAVMARFQDAGNAQSHFDAPLPAGSIAKLQTAAAEVSKVSQPFASFDGKHREVGKEFYTGVSERLRHKGRAVTSWDFEHHVLARFPSIYKVKCVQHTDQNCLCRTPEATSAALLDERRQKMLEGLNEKSTHPDPTAEAPLPKLAVKCCGPQIAPGHVLIVPIPNLKNRNDANPLQPKTTRRTLLEIEAHLKRLTSPFVHVHARNPVYEEVLVFFRVQFYAGVDKGYYLKKLNNDIVRYLTPWAFDDTVDVEFGKKVYASAIINFIEERPYVDFITDFIMNVCLHKCCEPKKLLGFTGEGSNMHDASDSDHDTTDEIAGVRNCSDMEKLLLTAKLDGYVVATPSTPRSILVSAQKHIIVPYEAPVKQSACEKPKTGGSAAPAEEQKDTTPPPKVKVEEAKPAIAPAAPAPAPPLAPAPAKDTAKVPAKSITAPEKKILKKTVKNPAEVKQVTKPKEENPGKP